MNQDIVEFKGKNYNAKHGSAFDRGAADSWYNRPPVPHKRPDGWNSDFNLSEQEVLDYFAGYEYNEIFGGKKEWN